MATTNPATPAAALQGYVELFVRGTAAWTRAWRDCTDCGLGRSWRELREAQLDVSALVPLLALAVTWTVLRRVTTARLFQPLARWLQLRPSDASKFPESAWKLLYYTPAWLYSSYLLFWRGHSFFHNPPSVFYGWQSRSLVPWDIYTAYILQGSFYAHSMFGTLYMDAWRRDSVVMLVHHFITLSLIVCSYAFRYHNVGLLAFFLHDASDIQLEFTKLNVYMKYRGGTYHPMNNFLSNIGCISFGISWFVFRLYWFPLKVLYATCITSLQTVPDIPFYFFFNILLFAITLINLYWFMMIMMFVAKVILGRIKEVNDVREYDVHVEADQTCWRNIRLSPSGKGKAHVNGMIKNKRQ
uniref:Ceramide synthase 1 n=1 Tax=Eptatretus burgeri TaxID=7764 RepID=A0A8C4QS21_EPTBU